MASIPSQNAFIATKAALDDPNQRQALTANTLQQVEQIKQPFDARNHWYEEIEKCYYLENEVVIPEGYQDTAVEIRSPLPTHIINTVTAALSINPPKVNFDKIGIGDDADENVAIRQNGFEASWRRQEDDAQRELFRLFVHAVTMKGEGVLKTVERKNTAWATYRKDSKVYQQELEANKGLNQYSRDKLYDIKTEEMKRNCPYPIFTTDVPPESFYYVQNEYGITHAVEVSEVPYYDTLVKYGAGLNGNGQIVPEAMGLPQIEWPRIMSSVATLRRIELWNAKTCTYLLQGPGDARKSQNDFGTGYFAKQIKHGYGDPYLNTLRGPYFHAFGVTTSSREIGRQGLSIIAPFLHLFPALDSLLTIQAQAAFTFGYPAYKRTKPDEAGIPESSFGLDPEEQQGTEERIIPGYIYPYDIAPLDQPRTSVDLDKTISIVRALIDIALPSVVQGILNAGDAGYAINQAAHLARLAWDPIIKNVERALSRRVGFESWLIENRIKEPVQVYASLPQAYSKNKASTGWIPIGPKDLNGAHRYNVILQPEMPSNQQLELRIHSDKLKMRLETPEDAIRATGGDPVAVRRGWRLHEILNDPAFIKMQNQRIFRRMQTMDQEVLAGARGAVPTGSGGNIPPAQQQTGQPGGPGGNVVINPTAQQAPVNPNAIPTRGAPSNITPVGTPGTPAGAPGGIRNTPPGHQPLPGE